MKPDFITADLHFFHEKIVSERNALRRGLLWRCVEDMNEDLVRNWNNRVGSKAKVLVVGDVTFQPKRRADDFRDLWSRLNGVKYLNPGNHDECVHLAPFFKKIEYWNVFKDFFTSHIPLPLSEFRDTRVQVHGHTHQTTVQDPTRENWRSYVCVCLEAWNFHPAPVDKVRDLVRNTIVRMEMEDAKG